MRCCELAKTPKRYLVREDLGVGEPQRERDAVTSSSRDLVATPDSQVAEGLMEHDRLIDDNFVQPRTPNNCRGPSVT